MGKTIIKNTLLFILSSLLLLSLTTCTVTKPNVIYITKDSIVTKTETVLKDTIIRVPGDTIRFQIPCDKDTVFIYRSKSSSSLVQVKDGKITVQNNCDEKDLLITQLKSQIDRYKSEKKDLTTIITKEVKYIPKIYKFFALGFWILLITVAVLGLIQTSLLGLIIGGIVKIVRLITKRRKK